MAGDWNYTALDEDRYASDPFRWTGCRQTAEEEHFQQLVGRPYELVEFEQHEFTNTSSFGRARLDRVYANFGVDIQLDHLITCLALPRPGRTSTHRPLSFRIIPPQREDGQQALLPESIVRTEEWGVRVRLRHAELWRGEALSSNVSAARKLLLLKRAMQEVTKTMQTERGSVRGTLRATG